jgi:hypothetical protein
MSEQQQEWDREALELQANATEASADLDAKLARLQAMTLARQQVGKDKPIYEQLRDDVVAELEELGAVYYLDEAGWKHFATAVVPQPLEIDLEVLQHFVDIGELDQEVLDEVTVTKVVAEPFRRAVAAGRITSAQLVACTKLKRGTGHVAFSDPLD